MDIMSGPAKLLRPYSVVRAMTSAILSNGTKYRAIREAPQAAKEITERFFLPNCLEKRVNSTMPTAPIRDGSIMKTDMTNLNPVWSIGFQVKEALRANGLAGVADDRLAAIAAAEKGEDLSPSEKIGVDEQVEIGRAHV